jgi:hypothetical protein
MVDAITDYQPNDLSMMAGLPKVSRNRQMEAVAINDPMVPERIYQVLPNARPSGLVPLHPGSRLRRLNPVKFERDYGLADVEKSGVRSPHMPQEMTFAEPLANVQRNKAQYIKSLGNLHNQQ